MPNDLHLCMSEDVYFPLENWVWYMCDESDGMEEVYIVCILCVYMYAARIVTHHIRERLAAFTLA